MKEEDYDLVTEAQGEFPKIFWDKCSQGTRYGYEWAYELQGWSEDGREWEGGASWSFGELVSGPFEGEITEKIIE